MTVNGWFQILFFCALVLALAKPMGVYIHAVYQGRRRWLGPIETGTYRLLGMDPDEDQHWTRYAAGMLLFSVVSMLVTYAALLIFVVLTVFLAGLMVGRTPDYLGKKIGSREVRMAMLYVLAFPAVVLVLTGAATVMEPGLAGRNNTGPHGLSEILYAFTSAGANNGSAFAGLTAGTPFYNTLLGMAMLVCRFALIVPALALGGFLSERGVTPETAGTFPVDTPLFVGLLVSVIVIVGALTYFPVLSLGPVVEHLMMNRGRLF